MTIAVVALALVSSVRYVDTWQHGNPSEEFFANVRADLGSADAPVPLVDLGIPQALLWSYRYPENIYSHILRPFDDRTSFPELAIDDLYVLDDTGHLAPVGVTPVRSMRPTNGCGYQLVGKSVTIPLDGPVIGGGWWIQMEYQSTSELPTVLVAGDAVHHVDLPAGKHTVFFSAEGTFHVVQVQHDEADSEGGDPGLCVTSLVLGLPVPTR